MVCECVCACEFVSMCCNKSFHRLRSTPFQSALTAATAENFVQRINVFTGSLMAFKYVAT